MRIRQATNSRLQGFFRQFAAVTSFGLLCFLSTLRAQNKPDQPTADQIIQKLISRAHANEDRHSDARYTYTQQTVTEVLDSKGAVKKREVRDYVAVPISGQLFLRLVRKDGKPLEGRDAKDEQERERKFREKMLRPKGEQKEDTRM